MDRMPAYEMSTARLSLRQFDPGDGMPLFQLLGKGEVLRYFPNPSPPTMERVQNLIAHQIAHWKEHGYGWWAVTNRESGCLLGWCGLQHLPETGETEVGYLLGKDYWGQGFATEAARASLDFGFGRLGLKEIIALVHPHNKASIHVIEKLGMAYLGQFRYFEMELLKYRTTRDEI